MNPNPNNPKPEPRSRTARFWGFFALGAMLFGMIHGGFDQEWTELESASQR
jgi:hypothetical protein